MTSQQPNPQGLEVAKHLEIPLPDTLISAASVQRGLKALEFTPAEDRSDTNKTRKGRSPDAIDTEMYEAPAASLNEIRAPRQPTGVTDHPQPSLNVYARPYVPLDLVAINDTPARLIPSKPVRWIDYEAYVRTFAGRLFVNADTPSRLPQADGHAERLTPLTVNFDASNYFTVFWGALKQEVIAQKGECLNQALYKVPLLPDNRELSIYRLQVPGLREQSLRIELGDIVSLRQLWLAPSGEVVSGLELSQIPVHAREWTTLQHEATIWGIDRAHETLSLRIDRLLECSCVFHASFNLQLGRFGAQYRAIATAHASLNIGASTEPGNWMSHMLFPEPSHGELQTKLNPGVFKTLLFDEQLNYDQVKAVDSIVEHNYGKVPFLISGPPGTGKTKSLVELALQLVSDTDGEPHILVCAPSDPAADTLAQRLCTRLPPAVLLRLNAPSRSFAEVPSDLLVYTFIEDDSFSLPPFPQMMQYKIVVTTCRDAEVLLCAKLSNRNLYDLERGLLTSLYPARPMPTPSLHWTALLMDEAAQATEPEALIPLTLVAPPDTVDCHIAPQFVMAGDERQLGPRTASRNLIIDTSLLARLFDRPLYRKHPLARSQRRGHAGLTQEMLPITRPPFATLHCNYRSHAAILAVPSALFYNDTLTLSSPTTTTTDTLRAWPGWRGRRWPVLFRANAGRDEIEQDGGGWYNLTESRIACCYARSLVHSGRLAQRDLCIMSPFAAQVRVLRRMLRGAAFALHDVNVGPLEAFQGLEACAVILCTTRARNRFVEQDVARGLGVLHEARRFNVALTRAREALVVIGNPFLLGIDSNWVAFMAFCRRHGLWEEVQSGDGEKATERSVGTWKPPEEATPPFVSRLERALVVRERDEAAAEGRDAVAGTLGRLGGAESEEMAMWTSGIAAEEALRFEE